jgi:hypothetical protein
MKEAGRTFTIKEETTKDAHVQFKYDSLKLVKKLDHKV